VNLLAGNVVAGFVKAGTGSANLGLLATVGGNIYAGGLIGFGGCLLGKCFPNNSPGPPPVVPFPIIRSDNATISQWTAPSPGPGYTLYDDNNCGAIVGNIINTYAKKATKTLVRTNCPVNFPILTTLTLSSDLAIFAKGGISSALLLSNAASNVPGTVRNMHWIVPYDAATMPCTAPTISSSLIYTVSSDINMFVYSPCNTNFTALNFINGQIYGGGTVSNIALFAIHYKPVPVYGVDPASLPASSYTASVVYKREAR
jgi:hypothetical protein